MNDRTYELEHEPVGRLLARYATPAVFAMMVHSTYNLVDAIFVGRGVGTLALAGLAVAFPIQMLVLGIAQIVGIGSASVISRSLGEGNKRRAEKAAGSSFVFVAALVFAFAMIALSRIHPLLSLFGATEDVLPYAARYLSIVLWGSVFFGFSVSSNNIARAEGNIKRAMMSMIIGACVNTTLDPIFIFGLKMGVRGAATATVIAQFCSFAFLVHYFMSGKSMLHIRRGDLVPDPTIWPEVFRIGSSSLGRMCSGIVVAIILNNSVVHYGGSVHLAIIGVVNRVLMFTLLPLIGLVQGLQPIIGFNYGARNMRRVKDALRKALVFAVSFSFGGFVLLMAFPRAILGLFSTDPQMLNDGSEIIRIIVLFLPVIGLQVIGGSFFQAIGRARPAWVIAISRQLLFQIPLVLLLPLRFGLMGIWAAFPLADFFAAFLTAAWMLMEVRRLGERPGLLEAPIQGEEYSEAQQELKL